MSLYPFPRSFRLHRHPETLLLALHLGVPPLLGVVAHVGDHLDLVALGAPVRHGERHLLVSVRVH